MNLVKALHQKVRPQKISNPLHAQQNSRLDGSLSLADGIGLLGGTISHFPN
jgi:hypothetical protein